MKSLLILIAMSASLASCGDSKNKVDSGMVSGSSTLDTRLLNFEGVYDIVRMDSDDCGASVRILRECNGYRLLSNNRMGAEDFCNVVKNGEPDRKPPNPDRNPPNPDSVPVVTQEGNSLRSVVRVGANIVFTNTLTLNEQGTLTKISNFKSRTSRCVFQKR